MPPPALPRVADGALGEFGRNAPNGPTREVVVNIPPNAHVGQRLKILARAPQQRRDATTARRHNKKTPRQVGGREFIFAVPEHAISAGQMRLTVPAPPTVLAQASRISANPSRDLGELFI